MRKVVMFNMISLDGYFEGPDRDIHWHQVDEEFNDFTLEQLSSANGLVFRRITYQLMASFWPTPAGLEGEPAIAHWMNSLPKYVFSTTLVMVEWNNTQLISGEAVDVLKKLKQEPGKALFSFGSANLFSIFSNHGLIDEFRLMVNPIVSGAGVPVFKEVDEMLKLKLFHTKVFRNENVLLTYQPSGQ